MNNPVLSVCMITYNHEAFIRKAVQGVIDQKTSFPLEFIISNDCSLDNTHVIIKEIINTYPNVGFKYFNHASNKGMRENFIFALNECQGKYIAICEGDDFWIDPFKLQKQVEFLEQN